MNILKRELAPISERAWEEIDDTARDVLKNYLSARKFVDVDGPRGADFASVSLGRLDIVKNEPMNGVNFGIHTVQPLVESRAEFELDIWELDNINRGAYDIDLDALEDAAKKIAAFEEKAIYTGFEHGKIKGMKNASPYDTIEFSDDAKDIIEAVSNGITTFTKASVEGPYALIASDKLWRFISSQVKGYPLKRILEHLMGSKIILNPACEEAFLVSTRGGDLKLTIGQDLSIGYHSHTTEKVKLYFSESFTFQVIDPNVIINLKWKG